MKKFERLVKEKDAIISTRVIEPTELDNFNNRMYKFREENHWKYADSIKSGNRVYLH